jgi:hypothetical protein
MPKFFFDVRHSCGSLDLDDVGIDVASFEAAYVEAHHAAIDMWAEVRREGRKPTYHCFEVRDASNRIVLELPFSEALGINPGSSTRGIRSASQESTIDTDEAGVI